MKYENYDLVFSLGAACSCTSALRASHLQFYSYPMDWLYGSDFTKRIDILISGFQRFIEKNDLKYVYSERSISCDAYRNTYNNLTFNHDFPTGVPLDDSYFFVKQKYDRRISRLLSLINKAKKVLLVYIETPVSDEKNSDKDIKQAFDKLKKHYFNKKVDILYISSDLSMKFETFNKKQLNENIIKITANYKDKNPESPSHAVNQKFLLLLLKKYKLNLPFGFLLKIKLLRCLINILPFKSVRKKLRKKYHIE